MAATRQLAIIVLGLNKDQLSVIYTVCISAGGRGWVMQLTAGNFLPHASACGCIAIAVYQPGGEVRKEVVACATTHVSLLA